MTFFYATRDNHSIILKLLAVLFLGQFGERNVLGCKSTSTVGTNFMIGIPDAFATANFIALHINSANASTVRITAPYINFDETLNLDKHLIVNMKNTIINNSPETTVRKGIKITSTHPCSVTVLPHHANDAVEGFMALPDNALSTRYLTWSYVPYRSSYSEILIAAPENNTRVSLTVRHNYRGTTYKILMNQYDTYLYHAAHATSMSEIVSDKPVAVLSGNTAAQIPDGQGDYQHIIEQMIPVEYYAKEYIVPVIYPRAQYDFVVHAPTDHTSVSFYNGGRNYTRLLSNTSTYEDRGHYRPAVLIADEPISVMEYGYDNDNSNGDPFMTTVQAISQYQSSYEFITDFGKMSNHEIWDVTLVVTALTAELSNIMLNSSAILDYKHHQEAVGSPLSNYSVIYVNITHLTEGQFHTVWHKNGIDFGASIYSLPGSAAAYGYPLKFALKDKECQVATTTTTTTTTSTTTTTTPTTTTSTTTTSTSTSTTTSTTTAATTTTLQTTFPNMHNITGGMQCFSCLDIPSLKYCDRVTTCDTDEVCYVESYLKPAGTKLYKTGCTKREACDIATGLNECLQCCESTNFCNTEGCGDSGSSSVKKQLYCYDCTHIGEGQPCYSVQLCPSDQVCMVEKYVWGDNDFNYIMGCIHPHVCDVQSRSVSGSQIEGQLAERHTPACTHCCATDFCNTNCTSREITEIVG